MVRRKRNRRRTAAKRLKQIWYNRQNMEKLVTAQAKASVLTDALPYIQDFKGSTVLVKLGGSVMEVEENLDSIMADIAFMSAVGIKVVIVHGGGKAISKAIKMSGHEPKFVDGLRVTDEPTMEIVRKTLNNVVNPDIVARLNLKGANARPLHGNWLFAAKKIESPDRGYVGEVVKADTRAVMEMLYAGVIPVVTPLGTGVDDGHLYNINADYAAAALAKALKVRKFALVSDVPGLMKNPEDPTTLLSTLRLDSVAALKADGVISGGMLPKIESCEDAIRAGVKKVHLVDGRMAHSLLLEIFTREGVGTEITE
jgi:acetylglutamate kinase